MPIPLPTNVFELQDEAFFQVVKEQCGLTMVDILRYLEQRNSSKSNELTISSVLLERHPIIRLIIRFFENFSPQSNDSSVKFKHTVVETIISNHDRAKSRYCYNDSIREFASNLFILGGRNVYEFIRLNISGLLPSLPIIQSSLDSITNRINEGDF
ncbi:unnamed protein product, partial [Rotaria socialis]